MKAIQLKDYGGPEQLEYVDAPRSEAKPGQVVVRIAAASYNPIDSKRASGMMRQIFPTEFPFIPGGDFSGTIDSLSEDVDGFTVGDNVYGYSPNGGSYAEFIAMPADRIARKPRSLDHIETASLVVVAQTAIQALEQAQLSEGQTILIQGAGGAVGSVAVQVAYLIGARVIAVAPAESHDRLREYGAAEIVDYKTTPFESVAKDIDVVLDGVGGDVQQRSFAVLKPGGTLIALSQPPSPEEAAKHNIRASMLQSDSTAASLQDLAAKIDAGEIRPFVGRTYPLSEAAQAWTDIHAQHIEGKIVFTVA